MNEAFRLIGDRFDRFMDRPLFVVIWMSEFTKSINFDGDHPVNEMTRENAVDQCREGHVLRVYEANFTEGTIRNVTDELMIEAGIEDAA